ncbi:MAG TPA: hypothetical protein HA349_02155 [Methanotrichaceae archaeon]|nr:hypothetical protein [Methanotrichaceae archaeon]
MPPIGPELETGPDYPDGSISEQPSSGEPTSSRPYISSQPALTPSASSGEAATQLSEGEALTYSQASSIGGVDRALVTMPGLQVLILYNGAWTMDASGYWSGGRTNLLVNNDQPQRIWSYERYPNGREEWTSIGYKWEDYFNGWLEVDDPGWHQLAVYGENSGWSNVLWIYVWPDGSSSGPGARPDIQIVTQAVDPVTNTVYYSYNSYGRQVFRIKVLVTGLDKFNVRSVHYQLHPTFSPSEYTSYDPYNDFELELWTWGAFEMPITVTMKDGKIFEYDYYFTFGDQLRNAQWRGVPFVQVR